LPQFLFALMMIYFATASHTADKVFAKASDELHTQTVSSDSPLLHFYSYQKSKFYSTYVCTWYNKLNTKRQRAECVGVCKNLEFLSPWVIR
jgi:hypothetical protein